MKPVTWHWAPGSGGPACGAPGDDRGVVPELARVIENLPGGIPEDDGVCSMCLELERDAKRAVVEEDTKPRKARTSKPEPKRTSKKKARRRRRPRAVQLELFSAHELGGGSPP